jgi:hypothetical protein
MERRRLVMASISDCSYETKSTRNHGDGFRPQPRDDTTASGLAGRARRRWRRRCAGAHIRLGHVLWPASTHAERAAEERRDHAVLQRLNRRVV